MADDYLGVISIGEGDLGRTNVLKPKVNTGDAAPIHQKCHIGYFMYITRMVPFRAH